jgi:hypothetical protein
MRVAVSYRLSSFLPSQNIVFVCSKYSREIQILSNQSIQTIVHSVQAT